MTGLQRCVAADVFAQVEAATRAYEARGCSGVPPPTVFVSMFELLGTACGDLLNNKVRAASCPQ